MTDSVSNQNFLPPDMVLAPRVLTTAFLRAGRALGLPVATMNRVAAVAPQCTEFPLLNPDSPEGLRALLIIRCYLALHVLLGNDPDLIRRWMRTVNRGTGGVPAVQVLTPDGLQTVLEYLEAMRASA